MFSEIIDLDIYGKNSHHAGDYHGPDSPNGTGHTVVQCNTDSEYCQNQLSPPPYGWRRPGIYPKDYLFPHFVGNIKSDFCNKN